MGYNIYKSKNKKYEKRIKRSFNIVLFLFEKREKMSNELNFTHPNLQGYTVYSKSGCPNCTKVKNLLKEHSKDFVVVDCDEYLLENKEGFLSFIEIIAGKKYRTFPMVFLGENFIGGFTETKSFIEKENAFVDL